MGAIKFPHASGNSMSIAAPATNPASDLELKLPATIGTANQYLKNSSTPGTLEFASLGATGKVLQRVWNANKTSRSTSSTSKADTEFGVCSITPTKATSIIHVEFNSLVHVADGTSIYWLLYFDTASSGYGVVPNIETNNGFIRMTNNSSNSTRVASFRYDHDHNVTTEINYKVYWSSASSVTRQLNYDATYGMLSATEYDVTGDGQ